MSEREKLAEIMQRLRKAAFISDKSVKRLLDGYRDEVLREAAEKIRGQVSPDVIDGYWDVVRSAREADADLIDPGKSSVNLGHRPERGCNCYGCSDDAGLI